MKGLALNVSQGLEEAWERAEARRSHKTTKERFALDGGHCPCDVHGDPTCDYCLETRKLQRALKVCACGRLTIRATDEQCPTCDPTRWQVTRRSA